MSFGQRATKQDREMYCSNCGSEMNGPNCPVCGKTLPANAHGQIDTTTSLMLAGWWRRVGATFADDLILIIPTLVVASIFAQLDGNVVGALVALVLEGIYMVKFLSGARGQTIGNRVAATRVRDAGNGQAITLLQAFKRWGFIAVYSAIELAASPASIYIVAFIALVDNLYPLYDPRNQTLHDKFAGTIVVMA
jgi:uncharacterized RDD family membrane protein YckC